MKRGVERGVGGVENVENRWETVEIWKNSRKLNTAVCKSEFVYGSKFRDRKFSDVVV